MHELVAEFVISYSVRLIKNSQMRPEFHDEMFEDLKFSSFDLVPNVARKKA